MLSVTFLVVASAKFVAQSEGSVVRVENHEFETAAKDVSTSSEKRHELAKDVSTSSEKHHELVKPHLADEDPLPNLRLPVEAEEAMVEVKADAEGHVQAAQNTERMMSEGSSGEMKKMQGAIPCKFVYPDIYIPHVQNNVSCEELSVSKEECSHQIGMYDVITHVTTRSIATRTQYSSGTVTIPVTYMKRYAYACEPKLKPWFHFGFFFGSKIEPFPCKQSSICMEQDETLHTVSVTPGANI